VTLTGGDDAPYFLVSGSRRLGPLLPAMTDMTERVFWMDRRGIAEQWVSPWLDLHTWHDMDADASRTWDRLINAAVIGAAVESSDRLRPVVLVDAADGLQAAADLEAVLVSDQVPAVMVSTQPRGQATLGDKATDPFWAAAASAGVPVILHPPVNGPSCAFTAPVLQNVSGRVIDASTAVLDLLAHGVIDRHPDLRLIVVHGGGFLPYQIFRLDGLARAGLLEKTDMRVPPSELLRRLTFDTVALDPLSIEFLVARVGSERVLLGSDAPFPIGDPEPVASVRAARLPADAIQSICCDNARRLAYSHRAGPDEGETG
jgi:aminocarboxymuconate-semialdehyde decarboxylase